MKRLDLSTHDLIESIVLDVFDPCGSLTIYANLLRFEFIPFSPTEISSLISTSISDIQLGMGLWIFHVHC